MLVEVKRRSSALSAKLRLRCAGVSRLFEQHECAPVLVEAELDFHGDLDVHRPAVFEGRLKSPLPYGLDRFLVETEAQAPNHAEIPGMPSGVDDQREDTGPLLIGPARFLRIVRIGRRDRLGRRNAASNLVDASPDSPAAPGTNPRSVTYAYAAARARTDTAA